MGARMSDPHFHMLNQCGPESFHGATLESVLRQKRGVILECGRLIGLL
jgi:hypothetical protein